MSNTLKIVKIGGKIAENEDKLEEFLFNFSKLIGPKILVHGGGTIATEIGEKLGIKPNIKDGRRITDAETLDLVLMVYAGLINKKIVASLQAKGTNAIGLTGADLGVIKSHKRKTKPVNFGWVGDIDEVDGTVLSNFINDNIVPVLVPLTHDGTGNMLNTNADPVAAFTAMEMSKTMDVELIYCFEKKGVMDNGKVISKLDAKTCQKLINDDVIKDGMIPKINSGYKALKFGVSKVKICSYDEINNQNGGTNLNIK